MRAAMRAAEIGILVGCLAVGLVLSGWGGGAANGQEAKKSVENPPMFMRKFEGHGEMPVVKDYVRKPNDIVVAYTERSAFVTLRLYDQCMVDESLSSIEVGKLMDVKDVVAINSIQRARIVEIYSDRLKYDPKKPNSAAMLVELLDGEAAGRFFVVSQIGFAKIHPSYQAEFNRKYNPPQP